MAEEKKESFFKKQDWFISAALVGGLYLIMVIFVYRFRVEPTNLEHFIHFLPLVSILMVGLGILNKKKKEEEKIALKKARYEMKKEILKAEREKKK